MNIDLTLGHTQRILAAAGKAGLGRHQTAYVLATGYWETARTMEPVREAYYLGRRAEAYRKTLRYYPAYGRGFVQLTWQANYERAARELGIPHLATDYDLALDPDVAAQVLVVGSRDGWFTGHTLGRYISDIGQDYRGARRIINGTDCAAEIAQIAEAYENALSPALPYPNLRIGDRGRAVADLQGILNAQDFNAGATDGIFGSDTRGAVRRAQLHHSLSVDGIAGPKTWGALLNTKDE